MSSITTQIPSLAVIYHDVVTPLAAAGFSLSSLEEESPTSTLHSPLNQTLQIQDLTGYIDQIIRHPIHDKSLGDQLSNFKTSLEQLPAQLSIQNFIKVPNSP